MKELALVVTIFFSFIAYSQDSTMSGMDSMPGMDMPGTSSMPQPRPNPQARSERTITLEQPTSTPARTREQTAQPKSISTPRTAPALVPDLPESSTERASTNSQRRPVVIEKIGENTQKCDEPCVTCTTSRCDSTRSFDTNRDTNEPTQSERIRSQSAAGVIPQ